MITPLFGLACAGVVALAWRSLEERVLALLLAACWVGSLLVQSQPERMWSYGHLALDAVLVVVAGAAAAVSPRAWLAPLVGATLLQFALHIALQATDGSRLDQWRYLVGLDLLFAIQLASVGAPGLLRLTGVSPPVPPVAPGPAEDSLSAG